MSIVGIVRFFRDLYWQLGDGLDLALEVIEPSPLEKELSK